VIVKAAGVPTVNFPSLTLVISGKKDMLPSRGSLALIDNGNCASLGIRADSRTFSNELRGIIVSDTLILGFGVVSTVGGKCTMVVVGADTFGRFC
jgi:hypothetical protein